MNYQLTPDPRDIQQFLRVSACGCGLVVAVAWVLFAFGVGDVVSAILATVLVLVLLPMIVLLYTKARFGSIVVDADGIVLEKSYTRETYVWKNVRSIKALTGHRPAFPFVVRLLGNPNSYDYVEVRLRRAARFSPLLFRGGTEVVGIPMGVKTLRLVTPSPGAVVEAAKEYVTAEQI